MFLHWGSLRSILNHEFYSSSKKVVLYMTTFAVISSSIIASDDLNEFKDEQVYIFPKINDSDALQPTLQLLMSQQKYHGELYRLFEEMWENNKKNPNIRLLSHAILDSIIVTGEIMNKTVENIKENINNGTASEDYKKEPLKDETCVALLDSWKYLLEYLSSNDTKDYGLEVDAEVEAMQTILKLAIQEMEVYDTYLDEVYEESFGTRVARLYRKLETET